MGTQRGNIAFLKGHIGENYICVGAQRGTLLLCEGTKGNITTKWGKKGDITLYGALLLCRGTKEGHYYCMGALRGALLLCGM